MKDYSKCHNVENIWEAVQSATQQVAKRRYKNVDLIRPAWREIQAQLRYRGNVVDMYAIPPRWISESLPVRDMQAILELAGFEKDGRFYRWPH